MANTFSNPIYLDTFTAALEITPASLGQADVPLKVHSIEFLIPVTTGATCTITDQGGSKIFDEMCVTANQSIIKYYGGASFGALKIAAATGAHLSSGKIAIVRK
jgi:hypothetical protein